MNKLTKKIKEFFAVKKEWSKIKDELLSCYLTPYFSKLLMTHRPVVYIDGFAGKGKFDDGFDGSPLIALKKAKYALDSSKNKEGQINFYFIEMEHSKDLEKNVSEYKNAKVINGKYEDNIEKLIDNIIDKNIFLYIDPYGIKVLHFAFFIRIASSRYNSLELLLNLNTFGFIREGCNLLGCELKLENTSDLDELVENDDTNLLKCSNSLENMDAVAGGNYWRSIINDYKNNVIDGYEAEKRFAIEYCSNLKKIF